jgi:hypothetical protein
MHEDCLGASQVPRSSKLIFEDQDYALFSVTLFKRVADSFKAAARSKGFQVIKPSSWDTSKVQVLTTYKIQDDRSCTSDLIE